MSVMYVAESAHLCMPNLLCQHLAQHYATKASRFECQGGTCCLFQEASLLNRAMQILLQHEQRRMHTSAVGRQACSLTLREGELMVRSTARGRPALWGRPAPAVGSVHRCAAPGRDCLRRRCRQHKAGHVYNAGAHVPASCCLCATCNGACKHSDLVLTETSLPGPQLFTSQKHSTSSKAEHAPHVLASTAVYILTAAHR